MSDDYGVLVPYGGGGDGSYQGEPIHLSGTQWLPRPLWASYLYGLTAQDWNTGLGQLRDEGFTGVRVFAGALQQVGQTLPLVYDQLPALLATAESLGLFVQVAAITNSGVDGGYNIADHLDRVASICQAFPNSLLEIANEPYHPTQNSTCHDPAALLGLARTNAHGLSFALGAAEDDEPDRDGNYDYSGGAWNTAHLDRGRDFWNQVRRVKELWELAKAMGTPVMSGEPIGADEVFIPGKRMNDPLFYFTYGLLCRAFEIGCVFHSTEGLNAAPLTDNQLECARATIDGFHFPSFPGRYDFYNAGWPGSPVLSANFQGGGVVRCYSFLSGDHNFTACLGYTDAADIHWGNGWTPGATLDHTSSLGNGTLRLVTLQRS